MNLERLEIELEKARIDKGIFNYCEEYKILCADIETRLNNTGRTKSTIKNLFQDLIKDYRNEDIIYMQMIASLLLDLLRM